MSFWEHLLRTLSLSQLLWDQYKSTHLSLSPLQRSLFFLELILYYFGCWGLSHSFSLFAPQEADSRSTVGRLTLHSGQTHAPQWADSRSTVGRRFFIGFDSRTISGSLDFFVRLFFLLSLPIFRTTINGDHLLLIILLHSFILSGKRFSVLYTISSQETRNRLWYGSCDVYLFPIDTISSRYWRNRLIVAYCLTSHILARSSLMSMPRTFRQFI